MKITKIDSPQVIMSNPESRHCYFGWPTVARLQNGKIAVVADKLGYGVAPFLTANYNEVHLIDIDNFERNIKAYLEENEIKDVVYLNGVMSANTAAKTAKTDAMF